MWVKQIMIETLGGEGIEFQPFWNTENGSNVTSLVNRFANFSVGKQYRNTVEREREFLPSHFTQQNLSYWFFAGFKSPSVSPTENGKRWRHKKRDLNCGAFLFFFCLREMKLQKLHTLRREELLV